MDWGELFVPRVSLPELVLRASLFYLGIFLLIRLILKREASSMNMVDLLLVVLIADAAQNGMADDYKSITGGLVVVATLILWNFVIDFLSFRFPLFRRLIHPPPLPLIQDGRLIQRNLRREFISRDELMSQLHENGVEDISEVKLAYLEGDGRVSVIKK